MKKNPFLSLVCFVFPLFDFDFGLDLNPIPSVLFLPNPPLFTGFRFFTVFIFQQRVSTGLRV
jgi:hypothetical protein